MFIFTCLNFSHLQSTLHWMQYTYQDIFSTAQNSFWTCWFWCFLVFCHFSFHLFYNCESFPFDDIFHLLGEIGWIGMVEHEGHAVFRQKLLNTQRGLGRCACKSPIKKWANVLKESSKIIHWSQIQPLTTPPTGALIQMGWNTHLAEEACTTRGLPSRR